MTFIKGLAVGVLLVSPSLVFGAPYTEDFDVDHSANWQANVGPAGEDETHNYFFDYSTVGIPSAPNSSGGTTRGMKLQANLSAGLLGGVSASPIGQSFTGSYTLAFDWW